MKKLLFVIAFASFALSASAQVTQSYTTKALIPAGTLTVAASTTTTCTNLAVDVSNATSVGVYAKFQLDGSGTNSPTVKFAKSIDGTNYETTPSLSLNAVQLNGTTAVETFTKLDADGARYIKLISVQNGSSGQSLSNIVVTVGTKLPRPR